MAPVRLVHLGLGHFFRAHQAWYTERAPDAGEWGIAAFTGHDPVVAERLRAQGGLYTLVTRSGDGDTFEVVASLSRAHAGADHRAWLDCFQAAELAAVTMTVTEAGYLRNDAGGLDTGRPEVGADIEVLRADPTALVRTVPGRLVAGLAARRRVDAGPLALVPCDNVAANGAVARRMVLEMAELVEPDLAAWAMDSVSVVTTMVDRITPRTAPADRATVRAATGRDDRCPVVTEPFSEWVLGGAFPAGRPRWEEAGATFTDDVTPYEHRKLWLLNGGHSLLAYAGSLQGHVTVAEAISDETCRTWLEQWWADASPHLDPPAGDLAAYRDALIDRFANARIRHLLAQIAADGSQKLAMRIVPALEAERVAGRMPLGATRILAAWLCHLRGGGAPVSDPRAEELVAWAAGPRRDAVPRVLDVVAPSLSGDAELAATVSAQSEELSGRRGQ